MSEEALFETVERAACVSADGLYRYSLSRKWESGTRVATFIMLNPSTADADSDDPTIRRCIGFAKSLGCSGLLVGNLYAYRATKPADLWLADEPTGGHRNNDVLREMALGARSRNDPLIAAWGANAKPDRVAFVRVMAGMDRLSCLGVTKAGAPRHPLYVRADQPLLSYGGAA